MKFQKALILIAIPLAIWLFIDNFHPGYSLDQTNWPYKLYVSFFNDLVLPFCLYFLLCSLEKWIRGLRTWKVKAGIAFFLPTMFELGQLFYQKMGLTLVFDAYGGSFDPLDLIVYATGVLLAVFLERQIFAKYFKFWEFAIA